MQRLISLLIVLSGISAGVAASADPSWSVDENAIAQTDRDFYEASRTKGGAAWGAFASN